MLLSLASRTVTFGSVAKTLKNAGSCTRTEGIPHDLSIEQFCLKQGVPVNEFNKWYRDNHKRIHPIQVDGIPSEESKEPSGESLAKGTNSVRISITRFMSNGVLIKRKKLSYDSLLKFVEKLEVLC